MNKRQVTNSMIAVRPDLIVEWDYERNVQISPEDVSAGSKKKVWWKCSQGHEWQALIYSRSAGKGCPYCSNCVRKPVICVETGKQYESATDAFKQTGIRHISECCNGKLKTAGGFHWKYVD